VESEILSRLFDDEVERAAGGPKRWTLGTSARARDGYALDISRLDIAGFLANPVMLWNHGRSSEPFAEFPIGRWEDVQVETKGKITRLRATPVFADAETSPLAAIVQRFVEADVIRMASIRFRMLKIEPSPESPELYDVTRSELIEASITSIGADSKALAGRSLRDERVDLVSLRNDLDLLIRSEQRKSPTEKAAGLISLKQLLGA